MTHVVTTPRSPFRLANDRLEVHQIPAWRDNFIWLMVDRSTGEAAAIDGPEAQSVLSYCEERDLELTTVINTHTHPDHVGINRDLATRGLLDRVRVVGGRKCGGDVPGLGEPVDDGDQVRFGGTEGTVMLTEGHIDGHISLVFDDVLFCGDTMFGAGCGYLFDGPPAKMHESLRRLASLDGATRVCCAHEYTEDNLRFAWSVDSGNEDLAGRIRAVRRLRSLGESSIPSTIDEERRTNPFLRADSEPVRSEIARQLPEHPMTTPAECFAAARALKDAKHYQKRSDDLLPQ